MLEGGSFVIIIKLGLESKELDILRLRWEVIRKKFKDFEQEWSYLYRVKNCRGWDEK